MDWAWDRSGWLGPLVSPYFYSFSQWGSLLGETRKSTSRCRLCHPAQVWRGLREPGAQEAGLRSLNTSLSPAGRELFDDPSYVNIQNLDKARHAGGGAGPPNLAVNGSAPRDLFDMSECFSIPYPVSPSFYLVPLLLFPSWPPRPEGSGPGRVLCWPPLLVLSLHPQSLLKMPFGCLHPPSQWPWLSSSEGSPGSTGS